MPIRPENRSRYPADWPEISVEVRERDGQRCKWCKAPNGAVILRPTGGDVYIDPPTGAVFCCTTGEARGFCRGSEFPAGKLVKIVLTVAHLDHIPENVGTPGDRQNLVALCQKCHLAYDAPLHAANSAVTRRARKATGDLFETAGHEG